MGKIYQALEKSKTAFNTTAENSLNNNDSQKKLFDKDVSQPTVTSFGESNVYSPEEIPKTIDRSLITIHDPQANESEQFRLLKNNILFPENGYPPRSIMITSPSPNEGKSFVSANLAVTIAQNIDEYVLLMDCDLRSPSLHRLFGIPNQTGLVDYLSTASQLSSLLTKTIIPKLTLLPAGIPPKNPSELLSSEQMRRLIQEVTLRYTDRYIIFDTPPPYMTSEGNALSRQVDGIILVIRQGKTRKKDIENIIEIYGKEKILGVVQNFGRKRVGHGYGYYKYGYGYGK